MYELFLWNFILLEWSDEKWTRKSHAFMNCHLIWSTIIYFCLSIIETYLWKSRVLDLLEKKWNSYILLWLEPQLNRKYAFERHAIYWSRPKARKRNIIEGDQNQVAAFSIEYFYWIFKFDSLSLGLWEHKQSWRQSRPID